MIVAREHSPFLVVCVRCEKNRRPFRAKAYAIRTLLLCDWSFQWTATKPQTQWKGTLFGCEQPFLWGERCVTSQKTAAEEANISRIMERKKNRRIHFWSEGRTQGYSRVLRD